MIDKNATATTLIDRCGRASIIREARLHVELSFWVASDFRQQGHVTRKDATLVGLMVS